MEWASSVWIAAPPVLVWRVLAEVESWPEWTPSVRSIVRVDPGPLRVGQRVRISQPWLPTTVWRLTELVEGSSFTWAAGGPGARTFARHGVAADGDGTLATLRLSLHGPVGLLVGALSSRLNRRYLELETSGLKRRCESG